MTRIVTVLEAHVHHEARSRATRLLESHHARAASVTTALAEPSATRAPGEGWSAVSARPHSAPATMA
jgi:hypothetical protein